MLHPQSPAPSRVLLTGATGFVGAAAYEPLCRAGFDVRGATRDPERARRRYPERTFVQMDMADEPSVQRALDDCSHAVYLVHAMGDDSGDDYADAEKAAAERFRAAAERAGVSRIVYLGGTRPNGPASKHLQSRMVVGEILRGASADVFELQASMIIGAGSESFRMVRDLAVRLPVMTIPSWAGSKTEPIAIADVCEAIVFALARLDGPSRVVPVPGPEVVTARDVLERVARLDGHRPIMFDVPFVTPRLSSLWVRFISRCDYHVAREIIEGLRVDIVAPNQGLWLAHTAHRRQPLDEAIRDALAAEAQTLSPTARRIEAAIRAVSRPVPS